MQFPYPNPNNSKGGLIFVGYNYIPPRDMEFDGWLANFVNEFVSYAPKLGFSPTEVGTVTKALNDWRTDYRNFLNAQQNLKSLAITKDNYRRNIHSLVRGFVQRLSTHPAMTDELRQTFRIVPQGGISHTAQVESGNTISVPFGSYETGAPFSVQFQYEPGEGSSWVGYSSGSGTPPPGTGWQVTETSSDTGWQSSEPYVTTDRNGNPVEYFQMGGHYYTTGDYIPGRDGEFDGWITNFVSEFTSYAPMFGFTASEVSTLTKWLHEWRSVYTKFLKAYQNFIQATQAKNTCRGNVEGIVHNFVQRLYTSPAVNENILQQFRLTTGEGVAWHLPSAYEIPPVSVNLGNFGRLNIQFNWEPSFAAEGGYYGYPVRESQPTVSWFSGTSHPQPTPASEAITTPTFQVKSGGRRKARAS